MNKLDRFQNILKDILDFRERRDWKQFHNPKNIAESISLEAAELLEHFQWKDFDASEKYAKENKEAISEEAADILVYLLYFCDRIGIDILGAVEKKMKQNNKKYPIEKSKGNAIKYNKL